MIKKQRPSRFRVMHDGLPAQDTIITGPEFWDYLDKPVPRTEEGYEMIKNEFFIDSMDGWLEELGFNIIEERLGDDHTWEMKFFWSEDEHGDWDGPLRMMLIQWEGVV